MTKNATLQFCKVVFRAGCLPPTYTLPACMFRQSANAKGSAESRSALGSLYSRQHHSQNAPRLLCDVFLDFRSRSAHSRSATFKRSSARQSTRRLPHRALCALRRITAYLHKAYFVAHRFFWLRTANAALPPNKNARVFVRLGCASKFPHLRDLFRSGARNFPRHHEVGFGDVRRIFAFNLAQICAVQISGVIIEKSRRSCFFRCSPRLLTSFHIEKFHVTDTVSFYGLCK